MTNLSRKIATTAAAVVIAAGLVAGVASPAIAGPFPPVNPGPSVPSLPPGTVIQPVVQFPTCANILTAADLSFVRRTTPGFHLMGSSTTLVGTSNPGLGAVANADRHITCVFGSDSLHPYYLTIVAISSVDYAWLFNQYDLNLAGNFWSYFHAFPEGQLGYNARVYGDSTPAATGTQQFAVLSPNGWWITVSDHGNRTYVNTILDATKQFLAANPWRG